MANLDPAMQVWKDMAVTIAAIPGSQGDVSTGLIMKLRNQMEQAIFSVCNMNLADYNASVDSIRSQADSIGFSLFPPSFKRMSLEEANNLRVQLGCGLYELPGAKSQAPSQLGVGSLLLIAGAGAVAIGLGIFLGGKKNGKLSRRRR